MSNPYQHLDEKHFWKPSVADKHLLDIGDLWQPKFKIDREKKSLHMVAVLRNILVERLKAVVLIGLLLSEVLVMFLQILSKDIITISSLLGQEIFILLRF